MPDSTKWSQSLSISTLDENYEHDILRLVLVAFTLVVFLCSIALNIIYFTGATLFGLNIFAVGNGTTSSIDHTTFFNESKLAFYLWIFIFVWQFFWLCYGLTTIFRKSSSDYLYKYPPVMHWLVYFNFSLANILYITSLIFWSHNLSIIALTYVLLTSVSLYIAAFISLFKLFDYQREMHYTEKVKDVWSIRILVQNGLFLYASGAFIIFLIGLNHTLVTECNLSKEYANNLTLILFLVKLVSYFSIETILLFKYCKFVFTPWLVYAVYVVYVVLNETLIERNTRVYESNLSGQFRLFETRNRQYNIFSYFQINSSFYFHIFTLYIIQVLILLNIDKFITNDNKICFRQQKNMKF